MKSVVDEVVSTKVVDDMSFDEMIATGKIYVQGKDYLQLCVA